MVLCILLARRLTLSHHVAQVAKEPRGRRDAWVRAVLLDDENGGWGALDDAGEPLPWDFEYRNWKTTGPRMTVPQPALRTGASP